MEGESRRDIFGRAWKTMCAISGPVPSCPGGEQCRDLVDFEGLVKEEKH